MYAVAVRRELIARHFMTGADFGAENHPHSHRYLVEWRLEGRALDRMGFLVDIDRIAADLEAGLAGFRDRTLNELAAFEGRNPSVENLARVIWDKLARGLAAAGIERARLTVWESDTAWAFYEAAP
jgi:6-pyruvoyltetrahydropterin/6-carboxytetrahydropterin synthase